MTLWKDASSILMPDALRAMVGGHPLVAEVLARRGYVTVEAARAFLDPHNYRQTPPEAFPNLNTACERIERAVEHAETIGVWGDFDVDGQTSTALLVQCLRWLGSQPLHHIPVRAAEGHGVNIAHLDPLIDSGMTLMLTCDTGITAHQALQHARQRGVDVIVTDHHVLEGDLPPALAYITPRLLPAGHALESLPGVGVAYKLAEALLRRAGQSDKAIEILDLVALGIVADVAHQSADTRALLQLGLEQLRLNRRVGLQALMDQAGVKALELNEEHIGFSLAPRLNALGRLSDANPAVDLLTTTDLSQAQALALQLESLNAERQRLTRDTVDSARLQIERNPALLDSPVLILSHAEWQGGIVGIAANALVEQFGRPAILFSAAPGKPLRGSARSIPGINITACIAEQADLLLGFGGHPMAAGMALDPARFAEFKTRMSKSVNRMLESSGGLPETALEIDGELTLDQITPELASDFERLAPFGPGNPPLTFVVNGLIIHQSQPIGRNREHLQLTVKDAGGRSQKVLWWNGAGRPLPDGRFDLACRLRASNFRGERQAQLEWIDSREMPEAGAVVTSGPQILDLRLIPDPEQELARLTAGPDAVVWAEGAERDRLKGRQRVELSPASLLIIWTAPPSAWVLRDALQRVKPQQVAVFAHLPETGELRGFIERLRGLLKFTLRAYQGEPVTLDLARLAGACAQREETLRVGVEYLAARGDIHLDVTHENGLAISPSRGTDHATTDWVVLENEIRFWLNETARFRRKLGETALEPFINP